MSRGGRAVRTAAGLAVIAAVVAGTLWGDDYHFPFGPFRMYSTTNDPNGTVNTVAFEAVDELGNEITPRPQDFGMRPAEINGRVSLLRSSPEVMRHLARAWEAHHPEAPSLVEITLKYGLYRLADGRPVGYSEEVLATWRR